MGKKKDKLRRLKRLLGKTQDELTSLQKRTLRMGLEEGWLELDRPTGLLINATDKLKGEYP